VKRQKYDWKIKELSKGKYPEAELLQQVNGVGPITALVFVLTLEDLGRFSKSRYVSCYLGLVPKCDQSGKIDKEFGYTVISSVVRNCEKSQV
jgi:transposase